MAGVLALPRSAFGGWRGNVIRLDSNDNPISDDDAKNLREGDAADRLGWFFSQITHYGSPLIAWTNCRPRHMNFLKVVEPDPAISFLLLTQKQPDAARTIPELVDLNKLGEALNRGEELLQAVVADDELFSAAFYASVHGEKPALADRFLKRMRSLQEWLLLAGNLMSRGKKNIPCSLHLEELGVRFIAPEASSEKPDEDAAAQTIDRTEFAQLRKPEDFYRLAMNLAPEQMTPREIARAKHELAYLKQQ